MVWIAFAVAVGSEVIATLALRASAGFTRPVPSLVVVAGYAVAFWLLSRTLTVLEVGPVYATWAGLGTVGAAVGGWLVFGERLTPIALAGAALIVAGVVVMNAFGEVRHG
jgi:small multidrug resistance pump